MRIDIEVIVLQYYASMQMTLSSKGRVAFDLHQGPRGQGQNM